MSEPSHRPAACRVLHVITDLRTGGAEIQLARLVAGPPAPRALTLDLVGVVSLREGGEIGTRIERSGVRVWTLGARSALGFLRAAVRLNRLVRAERVDVVVAWLYHPMIATALPGVLPGHCRLIWNVRGTLPTARDKRGTRLAAALARSMSSKPERIVYNSERARLEHEASGFDARAAVVIPNGFEVPAAGQWRAPGPRPRVTVIARYHPMKDFPTFVHAIARLRAGGCAVEVELVGEGCDARNEELRGLLHESKLRDGVLLTGRVSSIDDALARSDVVVSPSSWGEGFQNVLAEAALAGVPVVSTDVGEAHQIVGDARFVSPPNDPAALAAAIERVLRLSPEESRAIVGARRQRLAAAYGVEVMRSAYARLCSPVSSFES